MSFLKQNTKKHKRSLQVRERMSLSTSEKGSLTMETAIVLPLFLFAFVLFISCMDMMRTQVKIHGALMNAGEELASYGYAVQHDTGKPKENGIIKQGISIAAAKQKVIKELGEKFWEQSKIKNGKKGLSFLLSSIDSADMIYLAADYKIKLSFPIFAVPDIKCRQQVKVKSWTGYDPFGEGEASEKMVYITETGTVYHSQESCTHLKLTIRSIPSEVVASERNENKAKYKPCEKCCDTGSCIGAVYITNQGTRYHVTLGCSGLKRSIYQIPLSKAKGRKPCMRCGGF